MDKYLPIKFYQRREDVDDRFTPALGGDELPKWVLEGEELSARSSTLIQAVSSLSTLFQTRKKEYDYVPIVASVSIDDNAIAKSHRSAITELFGDERIEGKSIMDLYAFRGWAYNGEILNNGDEIKVGTESMIFTAVVEEIPDTNPNESSNSIYYSIIVLCLVGIIATIVITRLKK